MRGVAHGRAVTAGAGHGLHLRLLFDKYLMECMNSKMYSSFPNAEMREKHDS